MKFHKPSTIVLGRQDDAVGYMDALKLIPNFTRTTFLVADSSSHNLQIERPDFFTSCVLDWIDRIERIESTS